MEGLWYYKQSGATELVIMRDFQLKLSELYIFSFEQGLGLRSGSPSPWCMLQTGTPPPLGSAGGPPPPEKDDSFSDDEWASWHQVLYFDWMVQNINERLHNDNIF